MTPLRSLLNDYIVRHPNISDATAYQYTCTLNVFARFCGHEPTTADLTTMNVGVFIRKIVSSGCSGRTANSKRQQLLTLWRHAEFLGLPVEPVPDHRRLGKAREVQRAPVAWSEREMQNLINACFGAKSRSGWSGLHWASLVSTAYDTCRRIGALLSARRDDLDWKCQTLLIHGENEKGRSDSVSHLSDRSINLLRKLPESKLLFDWPFRRDSIQRRFRKDVLVPAGLPSGRRDLFQRVRRSSYTFVARELGIEAATRHASHKSNLSQFYLDPSKMSQPRPVEVLPDMLVEV